MPDATDNDPWADLYADLGVTEKPARPAPAPHANEDAGPADDSAEGADAEEGDEDGDEEAVEGVATADDGTPKKRRRRRRRGKKKPGDEATGEAAGAADDTETPEYGRHAAPPAPARQPLPARPAAADYENDIDADGDEAAAPAEVSAEAERPLEGATTEMTRELIANWNVPSWEELVTGLHRPSH